MTREKKNRISPKAGTTMVEVMAALVIVVLMMVLFARILSAAADTFRLSDLAVRQEEAFDGEYYTRTDFSGDAVVTEDLSMTGAGVTIPLEKGSLRVFQSREDGDSQRYYFTSQEQ